MEKIPWNHSDRATFKIYLCFLSTLSSCLGVVIQDARKII